jgi:hypothetical protein
VQVLDETALEVSTKLDHCVSDTVTFDRKTTVRLSTAEKTSWLGKLLRSSDETTSILEDPEVFQEVYRLRPPGDSAQRASTSDCAELGVKGQPGTQMS